MRRIVGALLVGLAILGGLGVSVIARVGVAGVAAVAPPPRLPEIGDCVTRSGGTVDVVDCDTPHTAEVTAAFPPEVAAGTRPRAGRTPSTYQLCQQAAGSYVGGTVIEDANGWQLPPLPTTVQIGIGPGPVAVPGWSWRVCLVAPIAPQAQVTGYTGRLTDRAVGRTPAALRSCYTLAAIGDETTVESGTGPAFSSGVTCAADHAGEIMAVRTLKLAHPVAVGPSSDAISDTMDNDATRLAQCSALAQDRTGLADPTFGGALSVVIRLQVVGVSYGTVVVPANGSTRSGSSTSAVVLNSVSYNATCAIQAPSGRQLYRSLVGVAAAAPPLR